MNNFTVNELIPRVYFKIHKFRKQKGTFSGTCSNRTIMAKIGLVVSGKYVARSESGKMARVLYDKLFIRKGRLIERGVYLTNQLSYGGV